MPEEDIRRMLGLNAIRVFGFDADQLQAVADRVGPTVADLSTTVAMEDIPKTFSWSLARPVPLASPVTCRSLSGRWAGQVGTAPTTLSTWTPRPGSDPRLAASPKLNTPPSLPMRL